jgi:hypothetical protein
MTDKGNGSALTGALCPSCHKLLQGNLRHEIFTARGSSENATNVSVAVIFCGACGVTLATSPETYGPHVHEPGGIPEVTAPKDESSLAGQFQLRCRDLVAETIALGFTPGGWIGLINQRGAVEAAKHLLTTRRVLPVTRFLVDQGHPELTMEHEIAQIRWNDLFSDEDRAEAARRLAAPGAGPG